MIGIGIGLVGGGIVNQLPFRFTVNTNNTSAGSSTSTQFKLPLVSSGTLNAVVDWGDGTSSTITTWNQAEVTHTYATAGVYDIKITGVLRGWQFNNGGDRLKILNIINWGCLDISVDLGFEGCINLTATATDAPLITITSLNSYFKNCPNFNGAIGNWDVSNVIFFEQTFVGASSFNQNIGSWDTSKATRMNQMFNGASSFNQNIGAWNVSNVTTFSSMFNGASAFNNGGSADINNWTIRTASAVSMSNMFTSCPFNQNISSWNTSAVTNMSSMFQGATAFNQNIGAWNVSNVTSFQNMFSGANAFRNGNSNSINNWVINTTNFVTMSYMFNESPFNQPIGNWDVSMVTDMSGMLRYTNYNLYIGDWNTQNVTNMNSFLQWNNSFNQNIAAKTINAGLPNEYIAWDVSKVIDFRYMFWYNSSFNQPIDNWTLNNVNPIIMTYMFNEATSFNQPIGSWNTSRVTNMAYMFRGATAFNQDIGNWNVSNVTGFENFMQFKTAANYSAANLNAIYNGWSSRPVQPNLSISFGSIKYTAEAQVGKNILDFAPNNWTIVDGGI